jgi:hypothetical protein
VGPRLSLQGVDDQLDIGAAYHHEDVVEDFPLSPDAVVPMGRYDFVTGLVAYAFRPFERLTLQAQVEAGGFFDGRRGSSVLAAQWTPSVHLTLTLNYEVDYVAFSDRDQEFVAHLARLRFLVMLSKQLSIAVFAQANTDAGALVGNLRARYNVREGHDLFLVYDESAAYRDDSDPTLDRRTALLKYVYTFDLGY